tara:strand:- start:3537 stop:3758 length:222 start_codon:yes stop_codon:yes gene_type:complete
MADKLSSISNLDATCAELSNEMQILKAKARAFTQTKKPADAKEMADAMAVIEKKTEKMRAKLSNIVTEVFQKA